MIEALAALAVFLVVALAVALWEARLIQRDRDHWRRCFERAIAERDTYVERLTRIRLAADGKDGAAFGDKR